MTLVSKSFSEIVTFSRSSNATRVGPTGRVEYAPHNLATYSEQFDNAAWILFQSSVTSNTAAAPNGAITADTHIPNINNDIHHLYSSATIALDTQYNLSVYAKPAGYNYLDLGLIYNIGYYAGVQFDLTSGIIVRSGAGIGSTVSNAQITPVGNGWYRCSVAVTAGIAGMVFNATASNVQWTAGAFHNQSFSGDGTSGIYLWGAQLSVGPYALDYTPTTSAAVYGPRFDYDPVTLAARGLLVEEQRTNLCPYSEQFDNAAWTKLNTTATANAAVSPDGTVTADKLVSSGSSTKVIYQAISSAGTYAISIYAKAGEYSGLTFTTGVAGTFFNLATGTVRAYYSAVPTSSTITPVGNGWYRCTIVVTLPTSDNLYIGPNDNVNDTLGSGWAADGTSGIFVWGAQIEAGSFATSYIPTPTNSTVTRTADVASVNTLSPWFNATEGTLFAEFDFIGLNPASPGINQGVACFTDGTGASNNLGLLGYGDGSAARYGFVFSGSSLVAFLSGSASSVNTTYKSALATKANDFRLVNSGGSVISDTSGAMPTGMNQLLLGNLYFTTNPTYQNGHLRRFAYYPRALTTAELQALTA